MEFRYLMNFRSSWNFLQIIKFQIFDEFQNFMDYFFLFFFGNVEFRGIQIILNEF